MLEPLLLLLHPYCTINDLSFGERSGRRDSTAAENGRSWGTEGPEGADHPSVVAWPPGIPVGDQHHPHDPTVPRKGARTAALRTYTNGTLRTAAARKEKEE